MHVDRVSEVRYLQERRIVHRVGHPLPALDVRVVFERIVRRDQLAGSFGKQIRGNVRFRGRPPGAARTVEYISSRLPLAYSSPLGINTLRTPSVFGRRLET